MTHRTTADWQALSQAHHLAPFTDYRDLNQRGARVITRAEGVYLWDSEGNKILDGMAGLWCVNVGYGRQELINAATQQMQQLPYYNLFFQTVHPPAVELAEAIASVAPKGMDHVFFTGSGSEANDTVVRMVRHYWQVLGQPEKSVIIGRWNGYHGSTVAGTSLGGMAAMHAHQGGPIPGIEHINQPYWYGEGGSLNPEAFGRQRAAELEQKILSIGPDRVAAFIAEPIQGAGGVIIPPESYWPAIKEILQRYDILFVADEVICGFGRTGYWFGSDYYDLQPDLMPIAKGLTSGYIPMGGVIVRDRVAAVLEAGGEFYHGFTYSGHPVAAAVALANIQLLKRERIVERVHNETGPYLQKRWAELMTHPLVGEARGVGMVAALELVEDKNSRSRYARGDVGLLCREQCFKHGLVMRAVGDTMIISPPLVLTEAQVDELIDKAIRSLNATERLLRA